MNLLALKNRLMLSNSDKNHEQKKTRYLPHDIDQIKGARVLL